MADVTITARDVGEISIDGDLPALFERIYAARGIRSVTELELSLKNLLPPDELNQVHLAAERVQHAIVHQERILVVGDFDADGATSVALALSLLRAMGAHDVDFLVPNRFEFGYGLSPEIVRLAADLQPALLITVVNGVPILGRLVRCLTAHGFKKLIVVVGYLDHRIRDYLATGTEGLAVEFVYNPRYATTNNIYSLWLARNLIRAPFLLLESDLVFDHELLSGLLIPDRLAVARHCSGMAGTTVSLDCDNRVVAFTVGRTTKPGARVFKTVNIYSLSRKTWEQVVARLERYVAAGNVHEYYEVVFEQLVGEDRISFEGVHFDRERWVEIDCLKDLHVAETRFDPPHNGNDRRSQSSATCEL